MRGTRLPPEVLSDAEVRSLMDACGGGAAGERNRALIALLYRSGLRVSEALSLLPKDLDLEAGSVRVLFGKGGRSRVAGLDKGAAAVVGGWVLVREGLGIGPASPVFCTLDGGPLLTSYVRRLMARLRRRAGIQRRVHAHGLRHTLAAQLREEGLDIGLISRQLGHRSIATTARYLDHVAPTAVIRAMAGRAWA